MTILCPPTGVTPEGGFYHLPFHQCFMLASDDGITTVVACKLSLIDVQTLHSRGETDMTILCPPSGVSR